MESIWNAASRVVAPIFQPYKNRGVFLKTDSGHLFPSPLSGEGCPKGGVGSAVPLSSERGGVGSPQARRGWGPPFRLEGANLFAEPKCDVVGTDGLP